MPSEFVPHPTSRCIGCRLSWHLCACALAPRLRVRTQVLLAMHIKEWWRSSNTGHLLRLSTAGVTIKLHGRPGAPADAHGWLDEAKTRPVVLYPSEGATVLSAELAAADPRPLTLVVPDGTWSQARHIVKRVPGIDAWPRVFLPRPAAAIDRPRKNLVPERMSTYEALAQALSVLEDAAFEAPMMAFFRQYAARTLCMRGRLRQQDIEAHVASGLTTSHESAIDSDN